jgi:hypothetical protein
MEGAGKEFTNPGLDLKDFIGTSFTTAPDKKLYQLPDQQFGPRFAARFRFPLRTPRPARFGQRTLRCARCCQARHHSPRSVVGRGVLDASR